MKRMPSLILVFIILSFFLLSGSYSRGYQTSTAKPEKEKTLFLVIESGGHMGVIRDVIFTNDSRYLISASLDKTIRVWDVQTGKLSRVIRGKIGKGLEGSIYDLALSPDNEWLAAAGMLTECT